MNRKSNSCLSERKCVEARGSESRKVRQIDRTNKDAKKLVNLLIGFSYKIIGAQTLNGEEASSAHQPEPK